MLRALAIFTIVASHSNLFMLMGGAHVLLAIVGFNLGRFQLGDQPRRAAGPRDAARRRPRGGAVGARHRHRRRLLQRDHLEAGGAGHGSFTEWNWSEPRLELLVHRGARALHPAAGRAARGPGRRSRIAPLARSPCPSCSRSRCTPARFDLFGIPGDHVHRLNGMLWLVTLGWAISQARTTRHRLVVRRAALWAGARLLLVGGAERPAYLVVGLLALIWLPQVRLPALAAPLVGVLAASSLWIYLLHWRVYPSFEVESPVLATAALAGRRAWRPRRAYDGVDPPSPRGTAGPGIADALSVLSTLAPPVSKSVGRAVDERTPRGPRRHDQPAHLPAGPAGDG